MWVEWLLLLEWCGGERKVPIEIALLITFHRFLNAPQIRISSSGLTFRSDPVGQDRQAGGLLGRSLRRSLGRSPVRRAALKSEPKTLTSSNQNFRLTQPLVCLDVRPAIEDCAVRRRIYHQVSWNSIRHLKLAFEHSADWSSFFTLETR